MLETRLCGGGVYHPEFNDEMLNDKYLKSTKGKIKSMISRVSVS
jgi:hypothetical protein